jgi:hypothetical protein
MHRSTVTMGTKTRGTVRGWDTEKLARETRDPCHHKPASLPDQCMLILDRRNSQETNLLHGIAPPNHTHCPARFAPSSDRTGNALIRRTMRTSTRLFPSRLQYADAHRSTEPHYSLRSIILFVSMNVFRHILVLDISILVKSNMGQRE